MILTLTPNPSVDRTVFLDTLTLGSVNRSTRSWNEPSGKGINVALALLSHGKTVRAVLPVGGSVGAQLRQMLSRAELDTARIPIAGEIRTNISLAQPDGTVTKINETGPRLDQTEVDALIDAVAQHLDGADWLVCGGSLPAGVPDDFYATLVELAHHKGVPVVVDSSGAPLAASLPARPDLIKPNVHELAELVQAPLATLGDVIDAAQQIRRHGVGVVLASLGSDGALLIDDTGALYGQAPVDKVVSTVGAGDALLAGYLSAAGSPRHQSLASALQWGAAAVQHEGTLFTPADAPVDVIIHDSVDPTRPLHATEPAPTTDDVPPRARHCVNRSDNTE
jgi:1-phosphofructokinase